MFLQIILLNKFTLSYSNTGVRSVNLTDMRSCYHSVEIRSTIQSHAHASQHHLFKDYSFFVVSIRQQSRSNSSSTLLSQSHFFLFLFMLYLLFSRAHMHDLALIDCTRLREPPVIEPCFLIAAR
jgi:hypothetical protein